MTNRDLLLEFIQWCVDNPGMVEDIWADPEADDAPLTATLAVDEFLESLGEVPEPVEGPHQHSMWECGRMQHVGSSHWMDEPCSLPADNPDRCTFAPFRNTRPDLKPEPVEGPRPTGIMPGMRHGTGGNVLSNAPVPATPPGGLDGRGLLVEGLDLDELHAAITTADYYKPDWLDEFRAKRALRATRS